jgi:hypothetical protein
MLEVSRSKSRVYFHNRVCVGVGCGISTDIKDISVKTILKLLYYKIASFVEK